VGLDGRSRRFIFRYSSPVTGKPNEKSLGAAEDVPLAEAIKRAAKLRMQITDGIDPVLAAKEGRQRRSAEAVTYSVVVDKYEQAFATRSATADIVWGQRHHCGTLLNMSVAAIDTPAVAKALAPLQMKFPKQARRILTNVARLLDFAKVNGWRSGDNPANFKTTFAYLWPRIINDSHHAAMNYADVPAFVERLLAEPTVIRCAIAFTILMGARSGETLGACRNEIQGNVWVLPPSRTKQHREHARPLSPAALDVIALAKSLSEPSDYLFPATHGGKWSGRVMERCLHLTLGVQRASIHGFRSALRDFLGNETNVDFHTCEEVLGHAIGDPTVAAYRRSNAVTKMAQALNLWADHCMGKSVSNVVQFRSESILKRDGRHLEASGTGSMCPRCRPPEAPTGRLCQSSS
jgi:integrase